MRWVRGSVDRHPVEVQPNECTWEPRVARARTRDLTFTNMVTIITLLNTIKNILQTQFAKFENFHVH